MQISHTCTVKPVIKTTWEIGITWELRTATPVPRSIHYIEMNLRNKSTSEFRTDFHSPLGVPNSQVALYISCMPWHYYLITPIQNVQRRAAKLLPGLKDMDYLTRLKALPTLSYKQVRGGMIVVFKLAMGMCDKEVASHFSFWYKGTTKGNSEKNSAYLIQTYWSENIFFTQLSIHGTVCPRVWFLPPHWILLRGVRTSFGRDSHSYSIFMQL